MQKTIFKISKMDCPSEESLIRMKLDGIKGIKKLNFDIAERNLTVFHNDNINQIGDAIAELNLSEKIVNTETVGEIEFKEETTQRKVLLLVLAINFVFFIIELTTGFFSKSMGLVADSLDMLADSFVYAISLFAVGGSLIRKKNIAKLVGYFQITLAIAGFFEVLRRFFGVEEMPNFSVMIVVSVFALIANAFSLYILQKSKSKDAHIQASVICTSNDVIINTGVIVAGGLVYFLNSNKPDLLIGTIVFVFVISGALRILKLGK